MSINFKICAEGILETQSLKRRMQTGAPQIGIRSQLCSMIAAEALGFCGFDYVYLDMEHAPNNLMLVLQQCQALAGTPAVPVVRIPSNDTVLIQQLLDVGIENIVVPMVETVKDAERAASATLYPPLGVRSFAGVHRGNEYGGTKDYNATVEDRLCLIVQIESRAALSRISEISSVVGVTGILFGPADLAADFGLLGQADHPEIVEAIESSIQKVKRAGKFVGMSTGSGGSGKAWLAKGCDFVSVGGDLRTLTSGARRLSATAHGQTE
jgi:4-hydroxy-2-oxoheptanedioate aldolase